MNKLSGRLLGLALGLVLIFTNVTFADQLDFGSKGIVDKEDFTISEMLSYAIQDEYMARAEYEEIMDVYGVQRPFSSIIKSEETHIQLLEPLFEAYNVELEEDRADEFIVVPESLEEAFQIGVQAEIDNIAMYEKFLNQELPEDIRETFEKLKSASEKHLTAFERGLNRGNKRTIK